MKALVLGAGIVGITTAYELLQDGHEVTVIDREAEPAAFTSYSNAGLFAPGHAYAWSSPAAPGILLKSLWRGDQALRFRFNADPRFWSWMLKFWGQCTAERAALNTTRKVKLCNYSLGVFHETVRRTGVAFDGRTGGLLYLYRSEAALRAASAKSRILSDNGCRIETLDRDGMAAKDPALGPVKDKFAGALYAPDDESGDCRLFARNMGGWLKDQGVSFKFNTTVTGLETAFSSVYTDVVMPGDIPLSLLVEKLTSGCGLLGLPVPRIGAGEPANLVLVDLQGTWTVGEEGYASRSGNCCFDGRELHGRILLTVAAGAVVHRTHTPNEVAA